VFAPINVSINQYNKRRLENDLLPILRYMKYGAVGGCWSRTRNSLFYVITSAGILLVWDLLLGLKKPIITMKLCQHKLTSIAGDNSGALVAVGSYEGDVYLVHSTETLYSFEKKDRSNFISVSECFWSFAISCWREIIRGGNIYIYINLCITYLR